MSLAQAVGTKAVAAVMTAGNYSCWKVLGAQDWRPTPRA
jgi:hypothetical protein